MDEISDFRALIALWPSRAELGADCRKTTGHVQQWHFRNSIPAEYWAELVAGARRRNIDGVTFELLAVLAAAKRDADNKTASPAA